MNKLQWREVEATATIDLDDITEGGTDYDPEEIGDIVVPSQADTDYGIGYANDGTPVLIDSQGYGYKVPAGAIYEQAYGGRAYEVTTAVQNIIDVQYQGGQSRYGQQAVDYMLVVVDGIELYAEQEPAEGDECGTYDELRKRIIEQALEHGIDVNRLRFKYDDQPITVSNQDLGECWYDPQAECYRPIDPDNTGIIERIIVDRYNLDHVQDIVARRDMSDELAEVVQESSEATVSVFKDDGSTVLVFHDTNRAGVCYGGNTAWGDWLPGRRLLRTDDGLLIDTSGETVTE